MSKQNSVIAGTGMYVPERVVTTEHFADCLPLGAASFVEKRKIRERRWMRRDQATSDLLVAAARDALTDAGLAPRDVSHLVVATNTPDYPRPATSSVVQFKLGAERAVAFTIDAGCLGFLHGLDYAHKVLCTEPDARAVLVVAGWGISKHLSERDGKIAPCCGDGAGAVVVRRGSARRGFVASRLFVDGIYGQHYECLGTFAGGTARPFSLDAWEKGEHLETYAQPYPIGMNPPHWVRLIGDLLAPLECAPNDVAHYFFLQMNWQAIVQTMELLEAPLERAHLTLDRFGDTGPGGFAIGLHDCRSQGKLQDGDLVLFVGTGSGCTMGGVAWRWGE